MSRKPYDPQAVCRKCAHVEVVTEYCTGNKPFAYLANVACELIGEHFHRRCKRCGYEWTESTWKPTTREEREVATLEAENTDLHRRLMESLLYGSLLDGTHRMYRIARSCCGDWRWEAIGVSRNAIATD